jgi:hypothetical protein
MPEPEPMSIQTVRETLHLLGYLNARYGRPERAAGYFELMSVVDAMNADSWRTLATIQLALGKNTEAATSAAKAVELGIPPQSRALCHLVRAIALQRTGNTTAAAAESSEFLAHRGAENQENPESA